MKVSLNNKLQSQKQPVFNGFEVAKDENGIKYYNWSYPFDPSKYRCFLDVYPVLPDKNGDYDNNTFKNKYASILDGTNSVELKPNEATPVYLDYIFGRVENAPFAYNYRLVPKNNESGSAVIRFDAGDLVDKRNYMDDWSSVYNIVVPNGINSGKAGAAILIDADNFDVRYMYDKNGIIVKNPDAEKGLNTYKNFANHIGGSLAGVHKALQDGRLDLYDKIFLLPHTSGDRTSAAGYWLESGFQFSSAVDNVDTFTKFQNELFAKGKTLVADSALTSEGLSGIHIQSILKNGEDDVFFDWFKCNPLKNMTAKISSMGAKTSDIRHKLINPPELPEQNLNGYITFKPNPAYKKDQPTLIQVYSANAASPEQIADSQVLIEKYGNPNGDERNPLKYGNHNDIGVAYNYPIKFETYKDNARHFNEYNSKRKKMGLPYILMNSYMGTRLLTKFENFEFENKIDGGFYTWDANVDMVKFNYAQSNEDVEDAMNIPLKDRPAYFDKLAQKRCEVLDYGVSSLKYWTRKTNQSLNLYVAQNLKKIDASNPQKAYDYMIKLVEDGVLPRKIYDNIDVNVVGNVLNDEYKLSGADSVENLHNTILDGLMSYPLESAEVGKDILALFSTPYITNRATRPEYVGQSRLDLLKQGNPHLTTQYEDIYNETTDMYTQEMYRFAEEILKDINNELPQDSKLNKGADASDYGKYVLPIVTQEIAKYAVIKGLFPDIKTKINGETGGIIYDYDALRKKSLKSLDIDNTSQKTEAKELIEKLRVGIRHISDSDKKQLRKAVYKMIENTNLKSFQMAEMIVDRTKSGLSWRMDALKDFSNMDGLRNGMDSFEDNWEQVINIAKAFVSAIKGENPNAYVVAEVTDEVDLHKLGDGANSKRFVWEKYKKDDGTVYRRNDLVRKLLRETGIDTVANYSFFFTNVAGIFGKKGEDGGSWGSNQYYRMYQVLSNDKYNEYADDFLYSGPYDSIIKSYTFVDNHDKPRINHILSFDMGFGFANLNDDSTDEAKDYRKRAFIVLNPNEEPSAYNVNCYDYSYVSSFAVARGEALNDSFNRALDDLASKKDDKGDFIINPADKDMMLKNFKEVVAQMAAGRYDDSGMNYEAINFGVEEVHKVLKLVLDKFAVKSRVDDNLKKTLFDTTFKMALDPALSNSLGMDKFLVNAPGIPTIFAGDDLGSTGWERKTKNETQKNRSAVHHDWVDKYDFIRERKAQKDAIYMLRSRPALHALNDGAPFLLKKQYINGSGDYLTALLRYANDGNIVISLFNPSGVTHDYNKYTDPMGHSAFINDNKIDLSNENADGFVGLYSGLTEGMKFVNAYDKNDVYYVHKGAGDEYYLSKNRECSEPIRLTDNTLTLYHADDDLMKKEDEFWKRVNKAREHNKTHKDSTISFCGGKIYSNKIYNVSPVSYKQNNNDAVTGSKLAIVSK